MVNIGSVTSSAGGTTVMNTPTVVDADLRWREPLWRETGDGHGTTLVVTDAGLLVIRV